MMPRAIRVWFPSAKLAVENQELRKKRRVSFFIESIVLKTVGSFGVEDRSPRLSTGDSIEYH